MRVGPTLCQSSVSHKARDNGEVEGIGAEEEEEREEEERQRRGEGGRARKRGRPSMGCPTRDGTGLSCRDGPETRRGGRYPESALDSGVRDMYTRRHVTDKGRRPSIRPVPEVTIWTSLVGTVHHSWDKNLLRYRSTPPVHNPLRRLRPIPSPFPDRSDWSYGWYTGSRDLRGWRRRPSRSSGGVEEVRTTSPSQVSTGPTSFGWSYRSTEGTTDEGRVGLDRRWSREVDGRGTLGPPRDLRSLGAKGGGLSPPRTQGQDQTSFKGIDPDRRQDPQVPDPCNDGGTKCLVLGPRRAAVDISLERGCVRSFVSRSPVFPTEPLSHGEG